VFLLYHVQKSITLVHVFRLAEGEKAEIPLVGKTIDEEDKAVLDQYFPRWRKARYSSCEAKELVRKADDRGWRLVAIEVSRNSVPYFSFRQRRREIPAFIIGSEKQGISNTLLAKIQDQLYVPMAGTATCYSAGMALAIVASPSPIKTQIALTT
jgi:tRNA(Leu) C34 or U34 (ribose-2'-O)-methylase TrmL